MCHYNLLDVFIFFLLKFTTTVVSCTDAKLTTNKNGKKEVIDGFEVVLEDTILFPEGGGQVRMKNIHFLCNLLSEKKKSNQRTDFFQSIMKLRIFIVAAEHMCFF